MSFRTIRSGIGCACSGIEKAGKSRTIATRLALVAVEDADGDGADNETEPRWDDRATRTRSPRPSNIEARAVRDEWRSLSYRWQPFLTRFTAGDSDGAEHRLGPHTH
jgi:hypothetical protein